MHFWKLQDKYFIKYFQKFDEYIKTLIELRMSWANFSHGYYNLTALHLANLTWLGSSSLLVRATRELDPGHKINKP